MLALPLLTPAVAANWGSLTADARCLFAGTAACWAATVAVLAYAGEARASERPAATWTVLLVTLAAEAATAS